MINMQFLMEIGGNKKFQSQVLLIAKLANKKLGEQLRLMIRIND
jgi:hypothetical protein